MIDRPSIFTTNLTNINHFDCTNQFRVRKTERNSKNNVIYITENVYWQSGGLVTYYQHSFIKENNKKITKNTVVGPVKLHRFHGIVVEELGVDLKLGPSRQVF